MYEEVIITRPSHLGFGRGVVRTEGNLRRDVDRAKERK
jgi:hypothetical protein